MERINLLRKNLVYPDRLVLDAVMKGPRAPGSEGAWSGPACPPSPAPRPSAAASVSQARGAPVITIRSWLDMDEVTRTEGEPCLLSLRRIDSEPGPEGPPPLPLTHDGNEDEVFRTHSQSVARDRMSELLRRFAERAARSRVEMNMPPTPSSHGSLSPVTISRAESRTSLPMRVSSASYKKAAKPKVRWDFWDYDNCMLVFHPEGTFYTVWLFIVAMCFCYNAWGLPVRSSFPYQTPENTHIWLCIDSLCDVIYLIDVAIIKPRLSFLYDGFWAANPIETRNNYIRKMRFKMDVIALLPLEVFYLQLGTSAVMLRFPRLLKFQIFYEFYRSLDRVMSSPFFIRIGQTLVYIFYLIHLNACAYYKMSTWEGIGSNSWVYNGVGNAYLRCFYFSTKTATSIGKNPKPENDLEYMFMTAAWLMGVFVFALLIGQIRDIIATATKSQSDYKKLVDETMEYMRRLNLPCDLQRRVTSWFTFTWEQQHTLDESQIVNNLPLNLHTDVAINVHIQTLNKVQLFNDCDEALLRDLVLKLRPVIYLPGDLICRKGDVGHEMYIVKMGEVQVMGGENNNEVLATLVEGSVFGEISLLGINGANRRTADVRSKGYSNLFVLNKTDLNNALVHYPNAQQMLQRKAKSLMRKNAAREKSKQEPEIIIPNPSTPEKPSKLLNTIMQVVPEDSGAGQLLRKGSRAGAKKKTALNQVNQDVPEVQPHKETQGEDTSNCYCDKLRRKTLPKNLRRKKSGGLNPSPPVRAGLYKMRNCASEPCLENPPCNDLGPETPNSSCVQRRSILSMNLPL